MGSTVFQARKQKQHEFLDVGREMHLNGLGAPYETTLIPLNSVDAVDLEEEKNNNNSAVTVSTLADTATIKHSAWNSKKNATTKPKQKTAKQINWTHKTKLKMCGKMHDTENWSDGENAANDQRRKRREFAIAANKNSEQHLPTISTQPNN